MDITSFERASYFKSEWHSYKAAVNELMKVCRCGASDRYTAFMPREQLLLQTYLIISGYILYHIVAKVNGTLCSTLTEKFEPKIL